MILLAQVVVESTEEQDITNMNTHLTQDVVDTDNDLFQDKPHRKHRVEKSNQVPTNTTLSQWLNGAWIQYKSRFFQFKKFNKNYNLFDLKLYLNSLVYVEYQKESHNTLLSEQYQLSLIQPHFFIGGYYAKVLKGFIGFDHNSSPKFAINVVDTILIGHYLPLIRSVITEDIYKKILLTIKELQIMTPKDVWKLPIFEELICYGTSISTADHFLFFFMKHDFSPVITYVGHYKKIYFYLNSFFKPEFKFQGLFSSPYIQINLLSNPFLLDFMIDIGNMMSVVWQPLKKIFKPQNYLYINRFNVIFLLLFHKDLLEFGLILRMRIYKILYLYIIYTNNGFRFVISININTDLTRAASNTLRSFKH